MGGGDLNLKKSWHPHTMKNQERVWKAEQAKQNEQQKLDDLRKEINEERDREELRRLGESSGVLANSGNDAKLEWMYKNSNELINREEYLLGRKIDKSFETLQAEERRQEQNALGIKQSINHVEHECVPFSIREFRNLDSTEQVDMQRKTMEDPLMLIKQREMESRRKLLENPVKLKEIHRILKTEQELKAASRAKKSKKSKKSKKKKKHKKGGSDSSSSDSDSDDDLDRKLAKQMKKLKGENNDGELKLDKLLDAKYRTLSKQLDLATKQKKSKKSKRQRSSSESSSSDSEKEEDERSKMKCRESKEQKTRERSPQKRRDQSSSPRGQNRRRRSESRERREDQRRQNSRKERSRSPQRNRERTQRRQRSPERKQWSPAPYRRQKSTERRQRSPEPPRRQKTPQRRQRSPETRQRQRSPEPRQRQRSPQRRQKSPEEKRSRRSPSSSPKRQERPRKHSPRPAKATNATSKSKLNDAEREARLKEMMENASWREVDRTQSVKKHREAYAREEEQHRAHDFDNQFINKEVKKAIANQTSIGNRIRANLNNIQRSSSAMDSNFARK